MILFVFFLKYNNYKENEMLLYDFMLSEQSVLVAMGT